MIFQDLTPILVILILINGCGFASYSRDNPVSNPPTTISSQWGIAYATWEKNAFSSTVSDQSLEKLVQTKAGWVQIVVTWYQADKNANEIREHLTQTATEESLIHAIEKAHQLGLKVLLKPHLDCEDGSWRAYINPADKNTWFSNYKNFILYSAQIAKDYSVEEFCVGTELAGVSIETDKWKEIISEIKKIYSGLLVYAADKDEYKKVKFWDVLDIVGINAYFSLTSKSNPSYDELKSALNSRVNEIENFQKQVNKDIIITEIGYRSLDGANIDPWDWTKPGSVDLTEQENCYKAFFENFWGKSWLKGIYWWYWKTDPNAGGTSDTDFTPQNKPAEKVILQYYSSL